MSMVLCRVHGERDDGQEGLEEAGGGIDIENSLGSLL